MDSVQKINTIRPALLAQLEDLVAGSEGGLLLQPVLALCRPKLEARADAFLAAGPGPVDDALGSLAATLLALRSDDAQPVDVDAARAGLAAIGAG